jgi:arsenate reductase (glutaredoxin)
MAKYTILHNPRCTKSRNALKLLEEQGDSVEIIDYLDNPLTPKELKDLLAKADFEVIDLVRTKEAKEFGIEYKNASDTELIKAINKFPKIMQRPVIIKAKKATIARDENWLSRL